jgi:hypothetical protein
VPGSRQRGEAVRTDVVRDAKTLAVDAVDEVAGQLLTWCEGDGMDDAIEASPAFAEDLRVVSHVEWHQKVAVDFGGELAYPIGELVVLVGEGECGTLAMHCLGDAPGDRALARDPDDQDALVGKKGHCGSPCEAVAACNWG